MSTASTDTPYRVLARKYRPSLFTELIGQEALVRTLSNAITSDRLSHAYLLTGVRGVGKTTAARLLARALNCVGADGTGGPTITPCGVCEHCVAITEDRHVDVLEMDAASRTGVDDIRELIDGVRYRPVSARNQVYIIDEIHMLSPQAFNALLKTLEEPPPSVTFIFATTEVGLQGLVMLGLYVLGAFAALGSAALLNSSLLRGTPSSFCMELPPYRVPTLRVLSMQVWGSARAFLRRAGTLILAASVVLWSLLSFPRIPEQPGADPAVQARAQLEASAAAWIGRAIEPVVEPLGFDWRIGVGLIASLAAREVIVATLAQIYAVGDAGDFDGLRKAIVADRDPETGAPTFTLAVALSLLVFFVFALQCSSTVVVMARETGSWRWPALAFSYMLGLAYLASFATFRLASALL